MGVSERHLDGQASTTSQIDDMPGVHDDGAPLKRLMLAVLGDALDCLQRGISDASVSARHRAAMEAAEWVRDTTADHLFSFNCVCETLGINPAALRESLGAWLADGPRLARRAPVIRQTSVSISPYRRRKSSTPGIGSPSDERFSDLRESVGQTSNV
jgi:hypothetical protein